MRDKITGVRAGVQLAIYSKTGVYRGIHYFIIFALKHRLWVPVKTGSNAYPQSMFEQR